MFMFVIPDGLIYRHGGMTLRKALLGHHSIGLGLGRGNYIKRGKTS